MTSLDTATVQPAPEDVLGSFPQFPEEFVALYRDSGLWGDRTIPEEFRAVAARYGDRDAVVDRQRRLTYAELDANSDAIAAGLLDAGLAVGDRVTLQVGNTVATIELFYGLLKAGLVPVCTLMAHGHHEIDAIAAAVGARAHAIDLSEKTEQRATFAAEVKERLSTVRHLIQVSPGPSLLADEEALTLDELRRTPHDIVAARLAQVVDAVGPDDLAVMQLSGGTSGTPKLIPRLHAEYWYNGRATADRSEIGPNDRLAHIIPIVHNVGVHGALWPAHSNGACLVLDNIARGLDILETLVKERVTGMVMTPTFLAGDEHPLFERFAENLRWISMSGSKTPAALFDRFTNLGVTVVQNFGMTEGIIFATPLDAPEEMRRETVGFPISTYDEVRVVDPDDATVEVAMGEPGELIARGPYTIRGYFDAEEHNAQVFTPDGFYRTGDLMSAVEFAGVVAYRVEGRIKDLINRGGEKINASEIEGLLVSHPRIMSAAVVAMPDERLGERACVYLVSSDSLPVTLEEVQEHLQEREVAKFKWPERVETRPELPRTAVGKIAKRLLVAEIADLMQAERRDDEQ